MHLLSDWMPQIERILNSGGSSPTDFALHDEAHSFRVAQRMAELIPTELKPKLSSYEIALLLLSAYLHDIGMTPEQRKVIRHYNHVITGKSDGMTEREEKEFQQWLDDDDRGITPPLCRGTPTVEELRLAAEIVTYYCRARHNDWSSEWIQKNVPKTDLYDGWQNDLIKLCRSHQFGRDELAGPAFDPMWVGPKSLVINLRYLACILRIADILEFDPERTPEVIFRHREISDKSILFWYRDHGISLKLQNERVEISARPKTALIHRAIEDLVKDIDQELQLCRSLADNQPFDVLPGSETTIPHVWKLQGRTQYKIEPQEGTYEYIDGAFRPNTQRLLQLLSGNVLYGSSMVAVRELLQNAFDAVKEQMAYTRLQQVAPSDDRLESTLGNLNEVRLELGLREDGLWLTCTDTGVGMTKQIIQNYLLISGKSRRHDVLALERQCRNAGFALGRTGKFGIGVLSYFMIADRIVIHTRRSLEPGDADPCGWRFETEGVGSFGELRREPTSIHGSNIELHLRHDVVSDPLEWFNGLKQYLYRTIKYIPCRFILTSNLTGFGGIDLNPGWVTGIPELTEKVMSGMGKSREDDRIPTNLLSSDKKQKLEGDEARWQEIRSEAIHALKWKVYSGALPGTSGRYRYHFPYFETPIGVSIAFVWTKNADKNPEINKIGEGHYCKSGGGLFLSWKGISIFGTIEAVHPSGTLHPHRLMMRGHPDFRFPGFLEVDFHDEVAGELRIDRHNLVLSREAVETLKLLTDEIEKRISNFLDENRSSGFALLNRNLLKFSWLSVRKPQWIATELEDGKVKLLWKPLGACPRISG
jgi:hypothetical protein